MNGFKKLTLVAAVMLMVFAFTACGVAPTQQTATELSTSSEAPEPLMTEYANDFDGLVNYLTDSEVIAGEGMDMSADFIGAAKGQKFMFKYKEAQMTCELYEFDVNNLNEMGKEVLDSVKAKGAFKSLEKDVEAKISDNGKFVMIFVSSSNDEVHMPFIDRINEKFKTFNGK